MIKCWKHFIKFAINTEMFEMCFVHLLHLLHIWLYKQYGSFFLFCSTRDRTQDLMHATEVHCHWVIQSALTYTFLKKHKRVHIRVTRRACKAPSALFLIQKVWVQVGQFAFLTSSQGSLMFCFGNHILRVSDSQECTHSVFYLKDWKMFNKFKWLIYYTINKGQFKEYCKTEACQSFIESTTWSPFSHKRCRWGGIQWCGYDVGQLGEAFSRMFLH